MYKQMHVFVLCLNRLLRESVARMLNRAGFHGTTSDPPSPDACGDVIYASADVLVLDSLHLLRDAKIFSPDHREPRLIKCVLIAMSDEQKHFLTAIRLGALGYVLRQASAAEVLNAVRTVAQGEAICPPQYARALFDFYALRTTGATIGDGPLNIGTDATRATISSADRTWHDQ